MLFSLADACSDTSLHVVTAVLSINQCSVKNSLLCTCFDESVHGFGASVQNLRIVLRNVLEHLKADNPKWPWVKEYF